MRATKIRYAAVMIGVGLGALLDGILFERVLHWRLPAATAPWFPVLAWLLVLGGVFLQGSALRGPGRLPSTRAFAAWLFIGWGAFNVLEGGVERSSLLALAGVGLAVFGVLLRVLRVVPDAERRSGFDRRASSVLR